MKMRTMLLTAGLAIGSLGLGTGANAQNYNGGDRHHDEYRDNDQRNDRRYDRRDDHRRDWRDDHRRDWRGDRGHHYGWDRHQRCWTEWHHHHRVRICR